MTVSSNFWSAVKSVHNLEHEEEQERMKILPITPVRVSIVGLFGAAPFREIYIFIAFSSCFFSCYIPVR